MTIDDDGSRAFARARAHATSHGLAIVAEDLARPWGGFLVIDDTQVEGFAAAFFPDLGLPPATDRPPMSPKLLVVAPHRRLSWQYHLRRDELWSVVEGPVGVVASTTDDQPLVEPLDAGRYVRHRAGTRHRLVGLAGWGVLAEIWEHVDSSSPSDEADIVRIEDDFGRQV